PDVRGYGETGGPINWQHAQEDTLVWLDWLAAQPGVRADTVWTVGSSMGANLAVIGCADFESCAGSVAVSPGRNYFGYTPLAPALDALSERDTPVWFITSERDGYPALAARQLAPDYPNVMVEWLPGNAHGIDLLDEATVAEVIGWLASG
ncbi:MAG: alpha/beta fold hydrolase, partial [Chloroflexota bacterium]